MLNMANELRDSFFITKNVRNIKDCGPTACLD